MKTKTYSKPDFTMMRFAPSDNVAAGSCDYYETVTIPCLITGTHTIFYDNCGNGNNYNDLGSSIKTVESTLYFSSSFDAVQYLSGNTNVHYSTTSGGSYTYELSTGEYLIWTSGQTHAAKITPSITSGINASA